MERKDNQKIKIELPDGTLEATGSEQFLARVRASLVSLLSGYAAPEPSVVELRAGDELGIGVSESATIRAVHPRLQTIRDLYATKRPPTDPQTAALIAYYLSEVAPAKERRETIDKESLIKYFKLCPRVLPKGDAGQVLRNAKKLGYLDSAPEPGHFKLNSIGYNLVVHALPASPGGPSEGAPRPRRVQPSKNRRSRLRRSKRTKKGTARIRKLKRTRRR